MRHGALLSRWEFSSARKTNPALRGRVTEQRSSVGLFSITYCCILLAIITTSKLHSILGEELCLPVYLMQQCKFSDKTIFRPKCLEGESYSLLLITATHCWDNLCLQLCKDRHYFSIGIMSKRVQNKQFWLRGVGFGNPNERPHLNPPSQNDLGWKANHRLFLSISMTATASQLHCSEHPEEEPQSQDKSLNLNSFQTDSLMGRY